MSWFDTILSPIMWVVAWIMVNAHSAFVALGMDPSGWSWILSIIVLVVVIRILLIPLFVRQIRASRGMQIVQPEIQKLQKKYKGKTDPASRQAMQQEMMAIYRSAGTNPFASCLPILAQSPIFFALFRVLYQLPQIADGSRAAIGPMDATSAAQAEGSVLFGAPLSSWFLMPDATAQVRVVTVVLILAMCATQFLTQRQLTMKNMPASALDNPMARQQKMLMYIFPIIFAVTGVNFPIGVLIYWTTTNLWSMGQQFYVIRNNPAPGSEAEKAMLERKARKAARKGKSLEDEGDGGGTTLVEDAAPRGQRQQPMGKNRAKRAGVRPATATSSLEDDVVEVVGDVQDSTVTDAAVLEDDAPARKIRRKK
ncbi:membrane protein insertase YidC [Litorihabitans aurantiacus]|uniref:Membrane protein insertase YidC n=1 Tax=Litorihabitans aurantiacus TaxID=1930061 RepID=A0AA38CVX0_9MICO|nr:membrane protein insertase YidC [Litorihabitans aurantiacus]GMA33085.1 membrane protein insertase YidC [Litorihabitans aurantiacus]